MSQVTTLWQFEINYVVLGGIGISTLTVPVMVTTSRWFIKKRGLMIGLVQAGNGVGGFIFPPLTGWLILAYGWRSAYAILGVITFIGILVSGFFLKRDPKDIGLLPDGERVETVPEAKELNPRFQSAGIPLREALHVKQFWMIAGLFSCFGFCRSAFTTHLAAHIQDLGFSLTDGANVLAVTVGSSMFSRIGMGRVADTIGNRPAFMISFAATAVSLIWGVATKDLWGLYLFAFVFGFGWGNQAVLRFALTSEVFGLASLGLFMGALGFAEQATAAFGSYIAGYIFDVVGHYQPVFWIGVGISIVGILLAWRLKPVIRRAQ
jgi:MFS family permease